MDFFGFDDDSDDDLEGIAASIRGFQRVFVVAWSLSIKVPSFASRICFFEAL